VNLSYVIPVVVLYLRREKKDASLLYQGNVVFVLSAAQTQTLFMTIAKYGVDVIHAKAVSFIALYVNIVVKYNDVGKLRA